MVSGRGGLGWLDKATLPHRSAPAPRGTPAQLLSSLLTDAAGLLAAVPWLVRVPLCKSYAVVLAVNFRCVRLQ